MEWRNLNRKLIRVFAVACAVAIPLTACNDDDDPIAPPPPETEEATLELAVVDDAAAVNDDEDEENGETVEFIPGTFQGDVQLQVFTEGAWVDVEGLQMNLTLQLGTTQQQVIGSTTVDAGTFDGGRVVITNATVDVAAGTQWGEEPPLEEDVTVTIAEGEEVVAHYDLPVILQDGATVVMVLDLNSHLWMDQQALDTGAVEAAQIEQAIQLTVQ
jgi:hypothetical protein